MFFVYLVIIIVVDALVYEDLFSLIGMGQFFSVNSVVKSIITSYFRWNFNLRWNNLKLSVRFTDKKLFRYQISQNSNKD